MARQKGHIKYVGTLGEVRHFKIKGNEGYFAGLKGGPTAEQVKTAPDFIRTRENMSEFAACANEILNPFCNSKEKFKIKFNPYFFNVLLAFSKSSGVSMPILFSVVSIILIRFPNSK